MRDFFRGWRRKAGCLLLLFSLAITSAWVRSLHSADLIVLTSYEISSAMGLITLEWFPDSPLVAVPFEWYSSRLSDSELPSGPATFPGPGAGPPVLADQPVPLDPIPIDTSFVPIQAVGTELVPFDPNRVGQTGKPFGPAPCLWSWRLWGITVGERDLDRSSVFEFPYWMIAIPLTLLSAWLILKRPRPRGPAKDVDSSHGV